MREHGYDRYCRGPDEQGTAGVGCRCRVCKDAHADYMRNRRRLMAYGQWQPFVEAEPVRRHVRALVDAGMATKTIAATAGISPSVVRALLWGNQGPPTQRIRPAAAAALLAVTDLVTRTVDSTGTRRRVYALAAIGWTVTEQARRLDVSVFALNMLIDRPRILATTATNVAGLYDRLWQHPAPENWISKRIRGHAVKRGWFAPLAWDDDTIDDPDALPCVLPRIDGSDPAVDELTVQHLAAGHPVDITPGVRDEIIWRLANAGLTAAEIAPIARTTEATVSVYRSRLRRARTGGRAAA